MASAGHCSDGQRAKARPLGQRSSSLRLELLEGAKGGRDLRPPFATCKACKSNIPLFPECSCGCNLLAFTTVSNQGREGRYGYRSIWKHHRNRRQAVRYVRPAPRRSMWPTSCGALWATPCGVVRTTATPAKQRSGKAVCGSVEVVVCPNGNPAPAGCGRNPLDRSCCACEPPTSAEIQEAACHYGFTGKYFLRRIFRRFWL